MRTLMLCGFLIVIGSGVEARAGQTQLNFDFLTDAKGNPVPPSGLNLGVTSATFQAHGTTNPNDVIGVSAANNAGGPALGAPDLFVKNQGGSESGLGLTNDPVNHEHELTPYSTITFNVDTLETVLGIQSIKFLVGSAQNGSPGDNEGFTFSASKGAGAAVTLATVIVQGDAASYASAPVKIQYVASGQYSITVSGADIANYDNFSFSAAGTGNKGAGGFTGHEFPNIVLNTLTATGTPLAGPAVPEPSTIATAGLGLLFGLGALVRNRKARRAA